MPAVMKQRFEIEDVANHEDAEVAAWLEPQQ
jgi:hypothetical protein